MHDGKLDVELVSTQAELTIVEPPSPGESPPPGELAVVPESSPQEANNDISVNKVNKENSLFIYDLRVNIIQCSLNSTLNNTLKYSPK